jgi:hypothetical protein
MEASFIGNKQVDSRNIPESNTQKIPDMELDNREAERLKKGAQEPGGNKTAGAASRDPKGKGLSTIILLRFYSQTLNFRLRHI